MLPSRPGIELYVRHKRPARSQFPGERIVLFVHGSTSGGNGFRNLPLKRPSCGMEYIARRATSLLVDLRGYGAPRARPRGPAGERNAPLTTTSPP